MVNKTIKQMLPDYRPDEKFVAYGAQALTGAELLAVILRTGSIGEPSTHVAEQVLYNQESGREDVLKILTTDYQELCKIKGIGKVKALQIKAIAELSKRIAMSSCAGRLSFNNPGSIADYYMEQLRHLDKEIVKLLLLDASCHFLKDLDISQGTVNASLFSPREIFLEALKNGAVNIILIHNHPSGHVDPSDADIEGTRIVQKMGKMIGINLLDHIIIGDRAYYSFKKEGLF